MKPNILYLTFFAFFCFKSHSQIKKSHPTTQIVFNSNTSSKLTSNEINNLKTVYGAALKTEILDRPTRVLAMKEILRNRVVVKKIPNLDKPYPMLSEVSLFDVFVPEITRDAAFSPLTFNPLKYNFEFHKAGFQTFRVDGSNYYIIIIPQHYNN